MKRILFIIVAVMAVASCGESQAEKDAIQARKDYLKSSIKTTFEYIEKQNKAAEEFNSQSGPDDAVMMIHQNPFDTTYTFDRIDKAKGKKFDDLEKYLKEELQTAHRNLGLL